MSKPVIITVQLFGLMALRRGDEAAALPTAADARRLLAYLCIQRKAQARSALAGKLWPDVSEERARHALRQAIWNVNRSLPGFLEADSEQVGIHPQAQLALDCAEFENLVRPFLHGSGGYPEAARSLSRAVELYQGDLLDGYYDEWVLLERERLHEIYLQVLERLIVAYKSTLRFEQALAVALRLAGESPLYESAHREVMRLYHYLGNPAAAMKQFQICQETLDQELGIQPAPETAQLAQVIARQVSAQEAGAGTPFLPTPRPASPSHWLGERSGSLIPLAGRSLERNELLRLLQWTAGHGTLILVEGEAGVGKTRLLQEAANEAVWRGAQVMWGKATEFVNGAPLGPIVEAIQGALSPLRIEQLQQMLEPLWLLALQPLLPALLEGYTGLQPASSLPALEAEHGHNRLLEALGCLLRAWSQITPLVMIIEDLHWADEDTLETLIHLPRYLATSGITLIASYRSEEIHLLPRLSEIQPGHLRGRVKLASLNPDEAALLIQAVLGGVISPALTATLYQETRGNPLFILECLRSLYDSGRLRQTDDGSWLSPYDSGGTDFALPVPQTVEQVILHRLNQLAPAVLEILHALSVLGSPFAFKQVASLALTGSPGPLIAALQELVKRQLLVETSHGYHFQHDQIQQSVYESIPADRRLELHARVAGVLEENDPGQVALLAHHYNAGQIWEKAYHYHWLAAEKAQASFAYASARQHLQRALQVAPRVSVECQDAFELHLLLNTVLGILGKRQEQEVNLEQMVAFCQDDPQRLCRAQLQQANFLFAVNRFTEAETTARQAIELARSIQPGAPSPTPAPQLEILAEALITLAEILGWVHVGQYSDIGVVLNEAAHLCQQTGSLALSARLHHSASFANYPIPPNSDRIEEAQHALSLYRQLGDKAHEAELACALGAFLQDSGADYETTARFDHLALEIAQSIGYRILEGRVLNNLANLEATRDLNRALGYFDQSAVIFRALDDHRRASITQLNAANYRLLLLGDVVATQPAIQFALAYAERSGDQWAKGYALLLSALSAKQQQDLYGARRLILDTLAIFEITQPAWLHTRAYMAFAQVEQAGGHFESALAQLDRAEQLARSGSFNHQRALIQASRASVLLQMGDVPGFDLHSTVAMENWDPMMEYAWEIPFARYNVLKALGRDGEAAVVLDKAHECLEKLLDQLTPEQRALSCRQITQHRAILEAWQQSRPKTVRVRLPCRHLPRNGRQPAGENNVEIIWTVSAPEDAKLTGKVSLRRFRLARLLCEAADQGAEPTYQQLAEILEVSLRTIAQDMVALRRGE